MHQTVTRDDSTAWAGRRGRIGRSHFESVVHDPAQTLCFVCGPRAMVNESVSTLAALGVPAEAIRTEAWVVPRGGPVYPAEAGLYMPVTWKPASTSSTSPVTPLPASLSRNAAASATSTVSTLAAAAPAS